MYKESKIKRILKECKLTKSEKKEFLNILKQMPIKKVYIEQFIRSYCELQCCCDSSIKGLQELKIFFYQTVLTNSFVDMARKSSDDNIDKILENEERLETIFNFSFELN